METKVILDRVFFLALCLVVATINFPKHNINSISMILLVVIWLFSGGLFNKIKVFLSNKYALLLSSIFFIYLVGIFYSSNLDMGFRELKLKLPLLLFPLLFSSTSFCLNINRKKILSLVFILTTLAYSLYTLIAVYFDFGPKSLEYLETGVKLYTHSDLTIKINNHPTYLSFAIILSLILLFKLFGKKYAIPSVFLSAYFLLYLLLLSSKSGVIIFILLILYLINSIPQKKIIRYSLIAVTIFSISSLFFVDNKIKSRFYNEYVTLKNFDSLSDKNIPHYKKNQRLIAADIFFSQPIEQILLGVGTGDVQDYLDVKYRYYLDTVNRNAFRKLNYHNQFFEIIGGVGVLGGIILFLNLLVPLKSSYLNQKKLYMFFLLVTISFFFIESFFSTHRGVVYFSLFNSIFAFLWYSEA